MKNTRALVVAALTAAALASALPAQAGGPLVDLPDRPALPVARRRGEHPVQPRPGRPRAAGQRRGGGPDDRRVPGLGRHRQRHARPT